jgi:hypothetical protein
MLRKILAANMGKMVGPWQKKLHNEELHDLYSSPNIIWVRKWKSTIWVRHVTHVGKKKNE